jgi:hypothetical protein
MSYNKEISTVRVACEVSFRVGNMDYGTITVPAGTVVFRHIIKSKDAAWKPETVKVSDWFVAHDDMVKLCPESYMIDGKPSSFYLHDSSHYGITVPNANVGALKGEPKTFHKAHHY